MKTKIIFFVSFLSISIISNAVGLDNYYYVDNTIDSSRVTATEAFEMINNAAEDTLTVIDIRRYKQFIRGHIKRALNFDFFEEDFIGHLYKLNRKSTYIVYDRNEETSKTVLLMMIRMNFNNLYYLKNGIFSWKKLKFPIETINYE